MKDRQDKANAKFLGTVEVPHSAGMCLVRCIGTTPGTPDTVLSIQRLKQLEYSGGPTLVPVE